VTTAAHTSPAATAVPAEPLGRLFLRFLHFGCLAWGGPVAQIAMLRQAFVEEERWVSSEHFNRMLAMYQILPGPEAHEMCVYFGMLARGRVGGLLAGLGFMLPGFVLMFALSWLYVRYGLETHPALAVVFAAIQAAVAALVVRAVARIGRHVLLDRWLWLIAAGSFVAQLLGVGFAVTLAAGGLIYFAARRFRPELAGLVAAACCVALAILAYRTGFELQALQIGEDSRGDARSAASFPELFLSGLRTGLLSFGGAYTAIPILQHDAVIAGAWMSHAQFLDGLGLSGLLPAPLIIFGTFVGFIGGGAPGALLLTLGIFLPAFAFTLVAHDPLERLLHHPRVHAFLEGVTAAVVGLIAGTAGSILIGTLSGTMTLFVFVLALAALFYWNNRLLVPMVIAGAALSGALAYVF
jgi:chromate transporter